MRVPGASGAGKLLRAPNASGTNIMQRAWVGEEYSVVRFSVYRVPRPLAGLLRLLLRAAGRRIS